MKLVFLLGLRNFYQNKQKCILGSLASLHTDFQKRVKKQNRSSLDDKKVKISKTIIKWANETKVGCQGDKETDWLGPILGHWSFA